jgi:thiamine-monophosphate kinase
MNEFEFLDRLRRQTDSRRHSPRILTGIGDDASVIRETANRDLIVTTDLLVEGVDFYANAIPARLLGHKALAVSLSDIAAMGARPLWAFLSIGMPRERWEGQFKDEFFEGYLALADHFGVSLSGGDVSETRSGIVIDSIVLGEVDSRAAVKRSGARHGDQIFVTGTLGGAAAGLKLIEMGARSEPRHIGVGGGPILDSDDHSIQSLLLRQLRPEPRIGWGIILGEQRLATSMIDISDGFSSDLQHLCKESNAGAWIDASLIPLDDDVKRLCGRRALDPLALALHGGEDFELLFTVAAENVPRLPKKVDGVPISHLGEITNAKQIVKLKEKGREWDLRPEGYVHFLK